jgi:hypothetical protein
MKMDMPHKMNLSTNKVWRWTKFKPISAFAKNLG